MSLAVAMGTLALATSAQAAVIYEHGFGGSDGVNLFGTTVDVDNNGGGNTWSGTDGVFEANGDVYGNAGVWLPFAPTTGNIYQLSGSINYSSGDWITLGFAEGNPDANFNTLAATPYATTLVAATDVTTFDGEGLEGAVGHTGAALSGFNDVDIVLDATDASSANWTVAFYLEGALVQGPSTVIDAGTFPTTADLANIQYVGFSSSGATIGTIDDFSLTTIPEPTTTALLGLGGLALILRRRK